MNSCRSSRGCFFQNCMCSRFLHEWGRRGSSRRETTADKGSRRLFCFFTSGGATSTYLDSVTVCLHASYPLRVWGWGWTNSGNSAIATACFGPDLTFTRATWAHFPPGPGPTWALGPLGPRANLRPGLTWARAQSTSLEVF